MSVSPAREVAYQILRRVESGRGFAIELLESAIASELREVDRRLATELIMGVLRWRGELDFAIEQVSGKPRSYFDPEVLTILRLGAYQIRFLEKIPKSAAVNEAVEMVKRIRKRSAAGLVNAVLRKCEPAPRSQGRSGGELEAYARSARRAMPAWLLGRWKARFGSETAGALALASLQVPPTMLRVRVAAEREDIARELAEEGIQTRPGRYRSEALVVESGNIHGSKTIREGRAIIQDEASQLVADLVAPEPGDRVLDVCAAPGIKTGQLAMALGHGTLVACDLSAHRLETMSKLLPKSVPNEFGIHWVRLDATRELSFGVKFDRILVDVPCSGTGTLARNPEIKWRLTPADLPRLSELQTKILCNATKLIAPRGRLVYSTCSLELEENEQVVERVLEERPECRLLSAGELLQEFPALSSLFDQHRYFRTRPDLHFMDGFFAAVIARAP